MFKFPDDTHILEINNDCKVALINLSTGLIDNRYVIKCRETQLTH